MDGGKRNRFRIYGRSFVMAQEIIERYQKLGVEFKLDSQKEELHFKAPSGIMNAERVAELKLWKKEIICYLQNEKGERRELPEAMKKVRNLANATETEISEGSLIDGFCDQVRMGKEKTALFSQGTNYTYGELADYAVAVKEKLVKMGVRPRDLVAVMIEKNVWQIASVLGCLLAGGTYLPIDCGQPESRIQLILSQSQAKVVLICDLDIKYKRSEKETYDIINISELQVSRNALLKQIPISFEQPAYTIFTSGSTGVPKGVVVNHRAALNTITDINRKFGITSKDKVLGLANLAFDLSVYDIFGIFLAGGTLVFPDPDKRKNPKHWEELIVKEGISVWNSVPAQMQMLIENMDGKELALRLVLLSGDWIPVSLPDRILKKAANAEIISLGGATEAAIWSIYYPVKSMDTNRKSIPYGIPLANQQFYILDKNQQECEDGVVGDIYIAGEGLAMGYLNDDNLTKEKFIYHDFLKKRLYDTGDIGKYDKNGVIEFIGRSDHQVKINGHRVELSEIDQVLQVHPAISQAVSILTEEKQHTQINTFVSPQNLSAPHLDWKIDEFQEICDVTWKSLTEPIDRKIFVAWIEKADRFALSEMLKLLLRVGLFQTLSKEHKIGEIRKKLCVIPEHFELVEQWMQSLCKEQLLDYNGETQRYVLTKSADKFLKENHKEKLEEMQREFDFGKEYFEYFMESNYKLPELLCGDVKALDLLFPKGNMKRAIALYQNHICSRMLNGTMTGAVKKIAQSYEQNGKVLKILEIGAGVGGTSNYLIPALSGYPIEYHFTDVSPFFINEAEKRYKNNSYVKYGIFDINTSYWKQGYQAMEYDMIIGNNVFHNAKNGSKCLQQMKELLIPNGFMIILDTIKDAYYMQTSVKFNEGLSKFEDERGKQGNTFFQFEIVIGLGTLFGLLMGGMKKKQNIILESILNAVTAIPPIAYLIIFNAAWGNGVFTVLTAATVSLLLRLIKLVKTRTEIESGKAYVMCAVASGAARIHILFREILPNLIWDILRFMCLSCADLIVSIVGFSFIGLGLGDNVIDWGMMISDTHHYFMTYPKMTFYPVICIFLCTCSFYGLGKAIEKGEKVDVGN